MTCDQQQMFDPNSEPHGWTVLEVLTRDLYGALKSRTTVRAKGDFVDLSIEEYVGNKGRAKRTDVRLHASAVEAMRTVLVALSASEASRPAADESAHLLDDLRRKIAAAPRRQIESAPGVYTSWLDQGAVLDILDAAKGEQQP